MAVTVGSGSGSSQSKKHALVVPAPLVAHTVGAFRFAVQLAKRGVTITFGTTPENIVKLEGYEELQGLDFNLVSCAAPVSLLPRKHIPGKTDLKLILEDERATFQTIFRDLKTQQEAGFPGPTCIIADRFFSWVKDEAEQLNIPLYVFFSCGGVLARWMQEMPRLISEGTLAMKEDESLVKFEGYVNVPGLPPLRYSELSPSMTTRPLIFVEVGETMKCAEAIIINTFTELERPQIDEIKRQLVECSTETKTVKLFLIGPSTDASTGKDVPIQNSAGVDSRAPDSLRWLGSRPPQSVVYICLGSIYRWNASMIFELALALEAAGHSFFWALQPDPDLTNLDDALPAGFRERTGGNGLITTAWVPQPRILAHPSVGCFITHCGWNSLIEGVTSGLPMIGWPQGLDHHMNCRHAVEVLNVCVQVGRGIPQGSPVPHEEFEKALRLVMVEEEGTAMRCRVRGLMSRARTAAADGGPRQRALNDIAESIPGIFRTTVVEG